MVRRSETKRQPRHDNNAHRQQERPWRPQTSLLRRGSEIRQRARPNLHGDLRQDFLQRRRGIYFKFHIIKILINRLSCKHRLWSMTILIKESMICQVRSRGSGSEMRVIRWCRALRMRLRIRSWGERLRRRRVGVDAALELCVWKLNDKIGKYICL